MPRYFFDFRTGIDRALDRDEVGLEFATPVEAKNDAVRGLIEMARERVAELSAGEELSVSVRDGEEAFCTFVLTLAVS